MLLNKSTGDLSFNVRRRLGNVFLQVATLGQEVHFEINKLTNNDLIQMARSILEVLGRKGDCESGMEFDRGV